MVNSFVVGVPAASSSVERGQTEREGSCSVSLSPTASRGRAPGSVWGEGNRRRPRDRVATTTSTTTGKKKTVYCVCLRCCCCCGIEGSTTGTCPGGSALCVAGCVHECGSGATTVTAVV
uniref:(northern house mosquito) hypothetical protein n=1 Tax=Culex pipiens TaxID=7175 RepID=A0A8D8GRZ9_CULPI